MNDFSQPVYVSLDQDIANFSNEYSQPNGSSVKRVPIGSLDVFIRTTLSKVSQCYPKFAKKWKSCCEREVYLQYISQGF